MNDFNSEIIDHDVLSVREAAARALDVVYKTTLTSSELTQLREETLRFWNNHVNSGFLHYRKSMTEGPNHATLDWMDHKPGTARFMDAMGREYIDCLGGFGIFNVGHRNPKVTAAVQAQLNKQPLHSQEMLDPLRAYAAHLLSRITPGNGALSHWFFINSGTEAVEAGIKMAILHTGRKRLLACVNAFHGKTLGSLAATSKAMFRAPFLGALLDVQHVEFNNIQQLRQAFEAAKFTGSEFAGFLLEPIQGEGGIHVASNEYLREARRLCDEYGVCLIFDEVQSGMGRSGEWFACDHADVVPDLICLGKALGGGVMPSAACGGRADIWAKYIENPFVLTTTFGGNPMALAATIATINVMLEERLWEKARERGDQMMAGLRAVQRTYPDIIANVRGRGLMIGLEFVNNDTGVQWAKMMFSRRVLTAGTLISALVVRIEPPLTISEHDVDCVLAEAEACCREIALLRSQAAAVAKLSRQVVVPPLRTTFVPPPVAPISRRQQQDGIAATAREGTKGLQARSKL